MSDHIDDWRKLESYDTNIQTELHANLLKNNGINVSQQALSGIPGMNSGGVLWVREADFEKARQILDNILEDLDVDDMSDNSTSYNSTSYNSTSYDSAYNSVNTPLKLDDNANDDGTV